MGKFQVTQAEYEPVMNINPSNFKGRNLPVENVSWDDANGFCNALNTKADGYRYHLPTEA
jgi:formylglycine-generating enzyme required for sulfatase activity